MHTFFSLSSDTYAMAGMALQCVKDAGFHVPDADKLNDALNKIKEKILAARRTNGHIGNEFSTGLAVQVRISLYFFFSPPRLFYCLKEQNVCSLYVHICCDQGLIGNGQPGWWVWRLNGGYEEGRQKQHISQPNGHISDSASSPEKILPEC